MKGEPKSKREYFIRVRKEGETSKKVPEVGPYAWYMVNGVSAHAAMDEFVRCFKKTKYGSTISVTKKNLICEPRKPFFSKPLVFDTA